MDRRKEQGVIEQAAAALDQVGWNHWGYQPPPGFTPQAGRVTSGVVRTSAMLGRSMGILRLCEILREVQTYLVGSGECSPRKFWNFTASQVGSEAVL